MLSAAHRGPAGDVVISAARLATLLGLPPPTSQQTAVIEASLRPAVVIAGAGSGKTETMAARVVWLIANRLVAPEAVLGLTFTRKAADELGQRIRRRLRAWRTVVERDQPQEHGQLAALLAAEPTVLTYDAYAGRLVSEHAMRVGAEPRPRLLSQAVCWQLSDAVVRRHPAPLPTAIGALSSVVRYVLALSGQCADHLVTPGELEAFCDGLLARWANLPLGGRAEFPAGTKDFITAMTLRRALLPLVRAYDDARRAIPAVNFDDQLTVAARVAEVGEVRRIERERYAAVLLDEYQDTGHAQIVMLSRLFADGHPVTAVGDPFQSIYGWRGASAGNIGRFAETFPGAARYPLPTSWRNDELILRGANALAAPLRGRDPGAVELEPRPGAAHGRIVLAVTETDADEAVWLAGRLRQEWDAQPPGGRTAAVLVRRRSQIPVIHQALLDAGLPVEVVDLGGLLTTPEVVDVVSTLRVLADVGSGPALARLLTGARWRIGPRDLAALSAQARRLARSRRLPSAEGDIPAGESVDSGSLVEALDDLGRPDAYSAEGYRRLRALADELRLLRRRLSAPLPDLVADIERTIGVDIEVAARPDRGGSARAHLDRFLDEAATFANDADQATLGAFLAFLAAAEEEENGLDAGEIEVTAERVQVLTVHGAKGLEWDVVAVPGLVEGVFPSSPLKIDWTRARELLPTDLRGDRADLPTLPLANATDRQEVGRLLEGHGESVKERHRYEERRLAYVAMTRARSVLLVSGYAWDTAKTRRTPSPFLVELSEFAEVEEWFVPQADAANPQLVHTRTAVWPAEPLGGRRRDVETGAALVRAGRNRPARDGPARDGAARDGPAGAFAESPRAAGWRQAVDVLLAERERLARRDVIPVELPAQLSVSQLVALRSDPDELARRLRRPLPSRPAPLARRGTAFHAWLEQRWSAQPLLDIDELPGAADEGATDTDDLDALCDAFERSGWASRVPVEVEVPFEMAVGATVIRGRMDAVFADGDGWTVVDWKTGARPRGAQAQAAAVQLAAYRLAWAQLAGTDLARVGAAFHYVRSNETVRPADLLSTDGLRRLITGEL
jgi:DNA helicase-2/ATP-dependent DNA helicase PcrA